MNHPEQRVLDDINHALHLAKLNEDDINAVSQTLFFSKETVQDIKLLELDQYLLSELQTGQTLHIKGTDDENAVLCTDTRTYDVLGAETSNSLLITQNLKFFDDIKDAESRSVSEITVDCISYEYLAVNASKPHLKKLISILKKSLYKGAELEYEVNQSDLYTEEELGNLVQASRKELEEILATKDVLKINNKIRLLDLEYHFRVLSQMLQVQSENSWQLDEIDFEETINSLRDIFPEDILIGLFDKYTEESKFIDGVQLYRYKEPEVCRIFAQVLLHGVGKFNLEEFLNAWHESVPEGMEPREEYLYGIALINRNTSPNTIASMSEEDLPEDINARFELLFGKKDKWTVPEIAPYIQRLTTDKLDVNALLAKYARASNLNGVKYYSSKHGK